MEGQPGDDFFVVVDGTAEATVGGDPLGELGPGSFFGEMALIDGGDRSATVRAKTPMSLLVLGRHDFNEMLSNAMPHIAPKLMQCMGQRIRELSVRAGDPLPSASLTPPRGEDASRKRTVDRGRTGARPGHRGVLPRPSSPRSAISR